MHEQVHLTINGVGITMPYGATVAAAMLQARAACRISASGEPRTAFCGMCTCFECRATVDRVKHRRTCELPCSDGMIVETSR